MDRDARLESRADQARRPAARNRACRKGGARRAVGSTGSAAGMSAHEALRRRGARHRSRTRLEAAGGHRAIHGRGAVKYRRMVGGRSVHGRVIGRRTIDGCPVDGRRRPISRCPVSRRLIDRWAISRLRRRCPRRPDRRVVPAYRALRAKYGGGPHVAGPEERLRGPSAGFRSRVWSGRRTRGRARRGRRFAERRPAILRHGARWRGTVRRAQRRHTPGRRARGIGGR